MSTRSTSLALLLLLAPCLAAGPAHAAEREREADPLIVSSETFLSAHPDLKFRQLGLKAYEQGKFEDAFRYFKRGARYADKPSQGMVAEMLWRAEGVPQNRSEAYAWMDLAAERKYRPMLIQREIYWEALTPEEREKAIAFGEGLYEELGDAAAQPRLERVMRRAKRQTVGSRTGYVGSVAIQINTLAGPMTIDGSSYYHPDFWEPERYWTWQEKGWKDPPRGMVDVGPLSSVATPKPAEEPKKD
jgi:hypothetical protein